MDDVDLKILSMVQENARIPHSEIARRTGISTSEISERIRKLEEEEIICGYEARLNPRALGLQLAAFVFVQTDLQAGGLEAADLLARIPGVQEVHRIAGDDCYLVKLRVETTEKLEQVLRDKFNSIRAVNSTQTTIVLKTVKETSRLPLDQMTVQAVSA